FMLLPAPRSTLFPYTTLFRSRIAHRRTILQSADTPAQVGKLVAQYLDQPAAQHLALLQAVGQHHELGEAGGRQLLVQRQVEARRDRKSTRLNSSHVKISYAVF